VKTCLDFGASSFQGLLYFSEYLGVDTSWNVRSCEADPFIFTRSFGFIEALGLGTKYNEFIFHNLAISDSSDEVSIDCVQAITVNGVSLQGDYGGSSIVERKDEHYLDGTLSKRAIVPSIDVNAVLAKVIGSDSAAEIYIKMDIEGAEFAVLQRLLSSTVLEQVKELYVEWHARFWPAGSERKRMEAIQQDLRSIIANQGIKIYDHW